MDSLNRPDNSRLSTSSIIDIYDQIYASPAAEDGWHAYSTIVISSFMNEVVQSIQPTSSLDAGCGIWRYSGATNAVLVDLVPASFASGERAVIASLLELPFRRGLFDLVVCVGSVINYVDPACAVRELSRVLRPGGTLVLEYERAWDLSQLLPWVHKRMIELENVTYRGVPHILNCYHDDYIQQILLSTGLKVRRRVTYHVLSPAIEFLTRNSAKAGLYRTVDNVAGKFLSRVAANAILECVTPG